MHRFLQHVLPRGFVKVRYYGFFEHTAPCPLSFFSPPLTLLRDSLLWHAPTLPSFSLHLSTQPDFHVQLSYRFLTRDWESFFRRIHLALISKASSMPLRTA